MDKLSILAEIFDVPVSHFFPKSKKSIENIIPLKTKRVPLLGTIAAGEPILAIEDCRAYIEIDNTMNVDFCLQVRGDSMIDARINNGDIVFVRKQSEVENGEIAVVIIDDEATLKRVYKNNGGVILKPENAKYQPRFYIERDYKKIRVLGKAIFFQSQVI
jgi:repressor LexA